MLDSGVLEFTPLDAGAPPVLVRARGPFWTRALARQGNPQALPIVDLAGVASVEDFVRSPRAIRALGAALSVGGGAAPVWLPQAIGWIEQGHVSSLTALAESLGVDRAHFARAFAAHVGFAPSQFRSIVRVCGAMRGIEKGEAQLERAARLAGYTHQSHMTREFRALLGMTPGQWRWRAFASA